MREVISSKGPVLTPEQKLAQYNTVVTSSGGTPTATIETFGGKSPRTEVKRTQNPDGSVTIFWSDDTQEVIGKPGEQKQDNTERQSAYDVLLSQFKQYGLESLVTPLKGLIADPSISESEFTMKLRDTDAYKKRFAANAARTAKGLRALNEGDYIALEDQYQNIMRNYGLPPSYYAKGDLGRQESLEKFIAGDVSAAELEDRIIVAQDRVLKANPEVLNTLKTFYGDSISNGDILAYALNPEQGLKDIQRKVTAAEIGGAAVAAGLKLGTTPEQISASEARAQMLAGYGVTKEAATTGFQTVAEIAPRGGQLAEFYNRPTYNQMEAEKEVFNLEGAVESRKRRKQLAALEAASFSGSSGAAKGALERERVSGAGAI
jgi:hypothetical protein